MKKSFSELDFFQLLALFSFLSSVFLPQVEYLSRAASPSSLCHMLLCLTLCSLPPPELLSVP